jgi:hypothetical protein
MNKGTRIRLALAIAAMALGLSGWAAAAQASSIVYIKDHNVWLSSPDGAAQRQVTTDGSAQLPYYSPSQADDGTILAGRGLHFQRLDRGGTKLGAPLPSVLVGKPATVFAVGPYSPKISPDGRKLAYWIGTNSSWFDYGSNTTWNSPKDAVIWQDAITGAQLGFTMFYQDPSWLADSSGAFLNAPYNRQTAQIVIGAIGADHNNLRGFFVDGDALPPGETYWDDIADPEVTPAGDKLAALRGGSGETIRFYDTRGAVPVISPCYLAQPVGGSAVSPTWAPDGTALAWQEGDGIWSTPVGALDRQDCGWAAPRLLIPGGSEPDWGPVDVSPGPTLPQGGTAQETGRALGVNAARRIKVGKLLRRGLRVTVTTNGPAKLEVKLLARGRVVARRGSRLEAAGSRALVLKPSRPNRARVRSNRRLTLKVTATDPAGRRATATQGLRLTR